MQKKRIKMNSNCLTQAYSVSQIIFRFWSWSSRNKQTFILQFILNSKINWKWKEKNKWMNKQCLLLTYCSLKFTSFFGFNSNHSRRYIKINAGTLFFKEGGRTISQNKQRLRDVTRICNGDCIRYACMKHDERHKHISSIQFPFSFFRFHSLCWI